MLTIDRILGLADGKGITQAFICKQIKVDRSWLRTVKKQNSTISPERLTQIADILGTTVEYLNGETDDPAVPEKEKSPSFSDGLANDEVLIVKLYRGAKSFDDKKDIIRYMLKHIQPELYAEIVVDALAALNTNSAQ